MAEEFLTGQRLTADLLNSSVVDPVNETTAEKPIGRAYASSTQSIPNNAFTGVNFTAEDYDTHDYHSTSTNTSRVTPLLAGYYRFTGVVYMSSTSSTPLETQIRKNNASTLHTGVRTVGSTVNLGSLASAMLPMNGSTDYVEIAVRQTSGGSVNTAVSLPFSSWLEWEFIRPL